MRIVVVVLMLALLPLRLWATEGMAVRMAQEQLGASAATSMPADCPMMAKAGAVQDSQEDSQEEAPQASGHCGSCQLCSASACGAPQSSAQAAAPVGRPPGSARYASADQPPDLRPPIA